MSAEYRLVVDAGWRMNRYPKRDLAHAVKGVQDAVRDAERRHEVVDIWIEERDVTAWGRHPDSAVEVGGADG